MCSLCPILREKRTLPCWPKYIPNPLWAGSRKNVMVCCIAQTVEACNHLLGSLFFSALMLQCWWNLAKCISSNRQVLPSNNFPFNRKQCAFAPKYLFPVLWKRHITVMSYSKSSSTLTLYNSTSDCDSALIQAIEKNMTAFLSSFDMPAP